MKYSKIRAVLQINLMLLGITLAVGVQPQSTAEYPNSVYWGDTHVHSSYSLDANLFGNTSLDPEQALRFARGEGIEMGSGITAKLSRPLDFLLVADHSENMGVLPMIRDNSPMIAYSQTAIKVRALFEQYSLLKPEHLGLVSKAFYKSDIEFNAAIQSTVWNEITSIMDKMNTPGKFTALIGYEWGSTPNGNNLHRIVVYRDAAGKAQRLLPLSSHGESTPEALWRYLDRYEREVGGEVFAIPHNSNLSNGLMFSLVDSQGNAIDRAYAEQRARWEPLIEVTQIKGDSETHPFLSPDDEFSNFGTWDKTNVFGSERTEKSMLAANYGRSALKRGLQLESEVGVNPYKFGMIGSTDSHTSLATADDENFWGKTAALMPGSDRTHGVFMPSTVGDEYSTFNWEQLASGYAAVWATENTREAIFDSMRRKEVYATTGPRIAVRLFGGWDFTQADARQRKIASIGYKKGVPMGADLPTNTGDVKAPSFLVSAVKDSEGANLDRIQIVKGWLDAGGAIQEKVFDVVLSDESRRLSSGKVLAVGDTVNVNKATYTNLIGSVQLAGVWQDPEFSLQSIAFYYARVLEIPTPRWPAYDRVLYGSKIRADIPLKIQQRAYTSPIWYQPKGG